MQQQQKTETSSNPPSSSSSEPAVLQEQEQQQPYYYNRLEDVDRVLTGMTNSFLIGAFGGSCFAMTRGLPLRKTTVASATSCAVVGIVCFGMERLADITLRYTIGPPESPQSSSLEDRSGAADTKIDPTSMRLYTTHAWGGAAGGAIVGTAFQNRTVSGMILFAPLMVLYAYGDILYKEKRQERLEERLKQMAMTEEEQKQENGDGGDSDGV